MPDRFIRLLPECHADTALIHFLIPEKILSIHCEGCTEVANIMLSKKANLYRFIGIVDNDNDLTKRNGGFFNQFDFIKNENKLYLRQHPVNDQIIIILDKAIETFIIWNAQQVDIDITTYGFSLNIKRLGNQFKSPVIETDLNYLRLLTDLYTREAPGLMTLKNLLYDFIIAR